MLQPMLASTIDAPLDDPQLVYEPKYDGIRAIAEVGETVRLWSRLGNEKTSQFPEIAAALQQWARPLGAAVVLDGEVVALDEKGNPAGFQQLQGRIHLLDPAGSARLKPRAPSGKDSARREPRAVSGKMEREASAERPSVAFIVFDLLRDGKTDWRERPLLERRAALERLFKKAKPSPPIRISTFVRGNGKALYDEALGQGWEGLIAKHAQSLYKSGKRSPDWRKIKIVREQEFVIGGWTEPRQTRTYFGALLLGVYDGKRLIYVGHTGTGFNERELARVMALLKRLETRECPFSPRPKTTNERPHWVRPELVAQIKFTEWTADGKLRHPVYLGLRDDKKALEVRREPTPQRGRVGQVGRVGRVGQVGQVGRVGKARDIVFPSNPPDPLDPPDPIDPRDLMGQLTSLEHARRDGVLTLPDGDQLKVTNLQKVFWPKLKLTKGDLFRYYVQVAPALLPAIADRPLVMKRFPNGVAAQPFYQHRAPDVPSGVRSEVVTVAETRAHIVGGALKTLLYTTQLAAISQDPWFSRLPTPEYADCAAFDLDPSEGVPFRAVLDVARWIRDELESLGARGVAKTSGADGLHIYIALPPETPYEAGVLYTQIVAMLVEQKHPKVATTERSVRARGKRVYIDCFQNILGKTLASAYSARASEYAGVSTPLTWKEVDAGVDRHDFTIKTVPGRLDELGDVWGTLRKGKPVDLERVTRIGDRRL
jgi:bifunctional non-homologous end joining protein LigD